MKTIWIFLSVITGLTLACSSRIPRENPDGSPTSASVIMPASIAVNEIAVAVTDYMGKDLIKTSTPVDFWIK